MSPKIIHDALMLAMAGSHKWDSNNLLIERILDLDYCTTFHVKIKNKYGFRVVRKKSYEFKKGYNFDSDEVGNEYEITWDLGSRQHRNDNPTYESIYKDLQPEFRDIKLTRLTDDSNC